MWIHNVEFYTMNYYFIATQPSKLYRHVLRYISWPYKERFKKHKAVSHCKNVPDNIVSFRKKWNNSSGIYKITFLPFKVFTYYGSSSNLGIRFKYHYFNGSKKETFLGQFLRVFGWSKFSITVVELCPRKDLVIRENWYLSRFKPVLNVLISTGLQTVSTNISLLTRSKISAALKGRKDSEVTRSKKSLSRIGNLNPFFKKGPSIIALDKAAEIKGTKVYVYDSKKYFTFVNCFRSIRSTCLVIPISPTTLKYKINTGKPFKGYYYYTIIQYKL